MIQCSCREEEREKMTCPSRGGELVSLPSDKLITRILRKQKTCRQTGPSSARAGTQLENAEEVRVAAPARFSIRASLTLRSR
jgi:hypothetical protein